MDTKQHDPLIKLRDVEKTLGVHRITLLRWIKDGKLKATKIGQRWFVRQSVLDEMTGG